MPDSARPHAVAIDLPPFAGLASAGASTLTRPDHGLLSGIPLMSGQMLHVLLVEDNDDDVHLFRRMLGSEPSNSFELIHCSCMRDALDILKKGGVDIALLDLGLPDAAGLDAIRQAFAVAPTVPLIVLTGNEDDMLATAAIQEGAQDYLIKGHLETRVLPRILRHAVERHQMHLRTEQILKQQSQLKDEFLSHISHELRSPLTAIYQFSTIIAEGYAGGITPDQKRYLDIIVRNVLQLKSMIDDLLEVSRVEAGKLSLDPQGVSIADAITYALETLQGSALEKQIAFTCDIGADTVDVFADPIRLRQILVILIQNAVKFTPAHGNIRIETRPCEEDPTRLLVVVSDTGCGIPPEMLERIFQRHVQADEALVAGRNGLGLGLYICRELVQRQGGKIWAANGEQGARLSFTLPIFVETRAATTPVGDRRNGGDRRSRVRLSVV